MKRRKGRRSSAAIAAAEAVRQYGERLNLIAAHPTDSSTTVDDPLGLSAAQRQISSLSQVNTSGWRCQGCGRERDVSELLTVCACGSTVTETVERREAEGRD